MAKKEEAKKELAKLIEWAYKTPFPIMFDYKNRIRTLSGKSEKKLNDFISKYIL